ncbi:adenyl-nucleotide exchange factor sse1 [Apophysomyces sp. BC1015]|nr:adenyl-nucleotide exchange factor sse1 [Apophysomyces sp. BC1015]KAG0182029.1 adenyl-nucleotide exchange factor sse1 [Apophysomyces sp. BC1021]
MSVVGFDLGNFQSVVAVIRDGDSDIVSNEFLNATTPSLVSFGLSQRLIGRAFDDPEIQEFEKDFMAVDLVNVDNQVGVKVNHLGEKVEFSSVQLLAMYLNMLKETAAAELRTPVSDCVITIPGWFTDIQRRAVLDAAKIAKLNCLRLINDLTAAALDYGYTKIDLPKNTKRTVALIDIGQSSYSVAIISFVKDMLTVRGTAYDIHFGGRDFDQVLVKKLAAEIKEKFDIDVYDSKEFLARLRIFAERCKKDLSAGHQALVNISSIVDDEDEITTVVSRSEFENEASDLLTRVGPTIQRALENAGLEPRSIDTVEIIGGCTRIPAIKLAISNFFGKDISAMLDQEEAAARGAALQCALLSYTSKIADFQVNEICHYAVKLQWAATPEEEETEIIVFQSNEASPSTKILTFHRNQPFTIEAVYANPEKLPRGIDPWIGRVYIKNVRAAGSEPVEIKVRIRLTIHGVMAIRSVHTVQEKLIDEEVTNEEGKKELKQVLKPVKKEDLPMMLKLNSVSREFLGKYIEKEDEMVTNDKLAAAKEAAKNWLQEYGYDMRDKILRPCAAYIDPTIKDKFVDGMNALVGWIYNNDHGALDYMSAENIADLKDSRIPLTSRFYGAEERSRVGTKTAKPRFDENSYSNTSSHESQDISNHNTVFPGTNHSPIDKISSSDSAHNSGLTGPLQYRTYAGVIKTRSSLMFPSSDSPSPEGYTTLKTRTWRTGRSPGSVFFDITLCGGRLKEVLKEIATEYPSAVGGTTHKDGPQLLAEINFDEDDTVSRTQACTVGIEYKGTRILATEALQHEPQIVRLNLSGLPFLKADKLQPELRDSLAIYGRILDIGISRDAEFDLFMGDGYAILDRYQPEGQQPFADIKHHIRWTKSTNFFYATWKNMPLHCMFCHEQGHVRSDCPQRPVNRVFCYNCGEKGHTNNKCPHIGRIPPLDDIELIEIGNDVEKNDRSII